MRRIPHRLELVERSGLGGVVRRELVDDEHPSARTRHPCELGDYALGPCDVMERAVRARQVEVGAREAQRFPVSLDELRVRAGARTRRLEQFGHRVDPHDLPHERRESERERTGAGAHVEGSFVATRPDEFAHLSREPLRAPVLMRCDPPRGARETVSRRRHEWRGQGGS